MGLQQFERRLERMVEGAFAKAFRGELQPIELGRRLTREMDLHRAVSVRGLVAPNVFEVVLSEHDHDRFEGFLDALSKELVEAAREHARTEDYTFLGPVVVEINSDRTLPKSTFEIASEVVENTETIAGWIVLPDARRIGVGPEPVTIGRLPDCTVTLADPNVSRRHAEIRRDGDRVYLVDLGSTNGTRVNGVPVHQRELADGDVVTVGITALRFEAE
ncbi:MAG: FhaA domain-containing protein [Acidimicrobiales bacterium]